MFKLNSKKNRTKEREQPREMDIERLQLSIAEIAAESWRFEQAMKKVLKKMDVMEAERFYRQYGYFSSRVERATAAAGLHVPNLAGQMYSEGLPVQAMNLEEFEEDDQLIITQVIEPVIMLNGRVIKAGVVMVDRTQKDYSGNGREMR